MVLFFEYEMSKYRFMGIVLSDFDLVDIDEQDRLMIMWVGWILELCKHWSVNGQELLMYL